jgi:UDP-2,3-diacylglucosamine pyrophosphatase LpxH
MLQEDPSETLQTPSSTSSGEERTDARGTGDGFNYLLFSDVHLGSDIVPHLRPWATTSWLTLEADVDAQIVGLLAHYRRERDAVRPWCLILAGDFLDLVGMSLPPSVSPMRTELTLEEQHYGLGSAPDHVVHKVEAIARRHPKVFCALMEFIADGHSLVIVRGNHDIELHWRAAQSATITAIVAHAPEEQRALLRARIRICPWFFAVKDLLYVEHGHEFDAMCNYGDPLLPTCPRDPRRIRHTPFSVLLRNVARPTRGLSTSAYSYVSFGAYVQLLLRLGWKGTAGIAVRFAEASWRLMRESVLHGQRPGRIRDLMARARMRRFARGVGVSEQQLGELRNLYAPPAVQSLQFVIRSLYIDRIFASLGTGLFVSIAVLAACLASTLWTVLFAVPAVALCVYAAIGLERRLEPAERMRENARNIARMFKARWVVMGHTHQAMVAPLDGDASYVNLGYWGEDDVPEERGNAPHSPCTYLVIRHQDGDYRAELLSWKRPAAAHDEQTDPGKSKSADDVRSSVTNAA